MRGNRFWKNRAPHSEERCASISEQLKGNTYTKGMHKWHTPDGKEYFAFEKKSENDLPGKASQAFIGRWATDGTSDIRLKQGQELPDGWFYGRSLGSRRKQSDNKQ